MSADQKNNELDKYSYNKPFNFSGFGGMLDGSSEHKDLNEILLILYRRRKTIIGISVFAVILMLLFLLFQVPRYTAESLIQVNVRNNKIVDIESVLSGISSDDSAIRSELDVLQSRYLIGLVVDKLDLVDLKEFNPEAQKYGDGLFKTMFSWVYSKEKEDKKEALRIRSQTISNVIKRLSVKRKPRSYSLRISFTSESPELAAKFVNTLASEYLTNQLRMKFQATQRANEWLNLKISELKRNVRDSELAVQAFQEKHNLIESGGKTINDQQLSELNTQLILAKTEMEQAKARLRSSKRKSGRGIEASAEVLNSPLIQRLKEQETEVLRKKSDLSSKYGERHPKIINVNAELRDLRSKIDQEIRKIFIGLENEVEVATSRVDALSKSLMQLEAKAGSSTRARVHLAELTRERDANRALYESFLQRFKETSEGQGLEQADANIISEAEVPLVPSYPKKKVFLLLSLVLGMGIGVVVAFIIEMLDDAFRSTHQLEEVTSIPSIGMVPEASRYKNLVNYIVKKPTSVFAESLRSINTSIHFANPGKNQKVIMVSSSVPKEGKSSFSASIAALNAKSGSKVLLIDCDLRKPTIDKSLGFNIQDNTVVDYLNGVASLDKVIYKDEKSGLDFIPAKSNTQNSQELLSSKKMKDLLKAVSSKYDFIFIDTPPIMAVSDCVLLSKLVDSCVFVVRWEKTPRKLVASAIKQLIDCNVPIIGTVLTRVDLARHAGYGYGDSGYYYGHYKGYYNS